MNKHEHATIEYINDKKRLAHFQYEMNRYKAQYERSQRHNEHMTLRIKELLGEIETLKNKRSY